MLDQFQFFLDFARGGGGGSGSGGGGSGGSGSGGGSIIILLGYIPTHALGTLTRRRLPTLAAHLITWSLSLAYAIFWINIHGFGFLIALAALVGAPAGLFNWFNKLGKLAAVAKRKQTVAAAKDSVWGIDNLKNQATTIFERYQADWSNNDATSMQSYLTPDYFHHNQLMILALKQLGRQNIVLHASIRSLTLLDITDATLDSDDRFVMQVDARANDTLYGADKKVLYVDRSSFTEYWRFARNGQSWLLEGIGQATEDPYLRNNTLARFARSHGYFFSADWGWLLLPERGQLFRGGAFGTSDINNHVIGVYQDTLIQLYNYAPNPKRSAGNKYLIAQVAVPKTYGNIVVRKKRVLPLRVSGLSRVTLEWGDFNKRYEVWASDMERVTSFELLNPSFMVKLYELPFETNIEVVDHIIYFYSYKTNASVVNYELLQSLLYDTFRELKL